MAIHIYIQAETMEFGNVCRMFLKTVTKETLISYIKTLF